MNSKIQKIKNNWLIQAETLLERNPDKLIELKRLWNSNKLKEAYLFMDEFVQNCGVEPSLEFKRLDEDFYWLLH
jgi:hypothetical protein